MSSITVTQQPFLTSAAHTSSGQTNSYRVDCFLEGIFFITCSAISGTGAKVTLYPQTSMDNSTWFNHPDITAEVTATGYFTMPVTNFGQYLRVKYDITGPSASATFAIDFSGKAL